MRAKWAAMLGTSRTMLSSTGEAGPDSAQRADQRVLGEEPAGAAGAVHHRELLLGRAQEKIDGVAQVGAGRERLDRRHHSIANREPLRGPSRKATCCASAVAEATAEALGLRLQPLQVGSPDEFEGAFAAMAKERADAVMILPDTLTVPHAARLAELAVRHRLPSLHGFREEVEAGGLLSYGPSFLEPVRRAATYVDKILKGANPANLPVQQPSKFELAINLKTAKTLGMTIPASLLARADEVIE